MENKEELKNIIKKILLEMDNEHEKNCNFRNKNK